MKKIEIWGGVECTYNRVGDTYFDQLKYNGHDHRIEDLDRFAEYGFTALRYPFIWERIAPNGLNSVDWSWADARLKRLKELNIRPIAGFVHHGSGPRDTSLLDPDFGPKLSKYAALFAQRYPWVEDYTPINEQFTTARFSALYGVWYPHAKDNLSCFRALMNECRGTILSMREIRKVNPKARLIQTDDLGKASGTAITQHQVDYENERRWIGWDLLCGRVNPEHFMWKHLLNFGVQEHELRWFEENACPPDILGINHYPLSNRHLDERMERYPAWSHGGNGRDTYADVESVRIADASFISPETIFREAWQRYQIPIAITEVHIDAAREDQMRWYQEIWSSAQRLNEEGADIRAITAWGLLGHFDWHCLVSRCEGYYESGVFDLRSPKPRPTALAKMLHSLSTYQEYQHPLLSVPGWWRRPDRIRHPQQVPSFEPSSSESYGNPLSANGRRARPILITGATGTLGNAFARICERRGIPYRLVSRQQMDISDPQSIQKMLEAEKPWAVINTAGYVRVDQAESDADRCFRENVDGPANLAHACADRNIRFVHFSSDLVFDGESDRPYVESSATSPLSVYGQTKVASESAVLRAHVDSLVIRTSAFFGPWDEHNFLHHALSTLVKGAPFYAAANVSVSPTYVPDLVDTTLNLLIDGERGIWHLANPGEISWADLAKEAAKEAKLDPSSVISRPANSMDWIAPRPKYSVLGSERGVLLPTLDRALARYFEESQWRTQRWQRNGLDSQEQDSHAQSSRVS
ncbi:MAG: family 1 glycosylhydrolase [Bdellovibrionia bacterium]